MLVPNGDQCRLDPPAHGTQPVNAGVAGGTQGNEKAALVDARAAVVNCELARGPAGAATAAVAVEYGIAVSGKAPAGMCLAGVAALAQPGSAQPSFAAQTEEPGLSAQNKRSPEGEGGRPG